MTNAKIQQNRHITESCYNKLVHTENEHRWVCSCWCACAMFVCVCVCVCWISVHSQPVISPSNRHHIYRHQIGEEDEWIEKVCEREKIVIFVGTKPFRSNMCTLLCVFHYDNNISAWTSLYLPLTKFSDGNEIIFTRFFSCVQYFAMFLGFPFTQICGHVFARLCIICYQYSQLACYIKYGPTGACLNDAIVFLSRQMEWRPEKKM